MISLSALNNQTKVLKGLGTKALACAFMFRSGGSALKKPFVTGMIKGCISIYKIVDNQYHIKDKIIETIWGFINSLCGLAIE